MEAQELDAKAIAEEIERDHRERRSQNMGEQQEGARRLDELGKLLWDVDLQYSWHVSGGVQPEKHISVMSRRRQFARFTRKGRILFGTYPRLGGDLVQYDSVLTAFRDAVAKRIQEREAGVDEEDVRQEAAREIVDYPDA